MSSHLGRLAIIAGLSSWAVSGCGPQAQSGAASGQERRLVQVALIELPGQPVVTVEELDGDFLLDGDILLARSQVHLLDGGDGELGIRRDAVAGIIGSARWPGGIVPYKIDAALPDKVRVTSAIAHWEDHTVLRFIPRSTEEAYVTFRPSTNCSAHIGRVGGQQYVNLAAGCNFGSTVHEIGHVVGMFHEQARADRDQHVIIHWNNIGQSEEHNFKTYLANGYLGSDLGPYDFGSIMHYSSWAFTANGQPTITRLNGSTFWSNRTGLSADDIFGIGEMYGHPAPIPRPAVSISTPKDGAIVRGVVTVSLSVNDVVKRVELRHDDVVVGTFTAPPYSWTWNTLLELDGTHQLQALAWDEANAVSAPSTASVTVHNTDTDPPTVSLVSPAPGEVVHGTVLLIAGAYDQFGVTGVEFWADDELLTLAPTAKTTSNWDTSGVPNGPVTLRVRAVDASGNAGESAPVLVTVTNPDVVPPVVTLLRPEPGQRLGGTVILEADARDGEGVVRVSFTAGDRLLGTVTRPPWELEWDTTQHPAGATAIEVSAWDEAGNRGTSAPVIVVVEGPAEETKAGGCSSVPGGTSWLPLMGLGLLLALRGRHG